jgi:hypothetical protein
MHTSESKTLLARIDAYVAGNAPDLDALTLLRECRAFVSGCIVQASLLEGEIKDIRVREMQARAHLAATQTRLSRLLDGLRDV